MSLLAGALCALAVTSASVPPQPLKVEKVVKADLLEFEGTAGEGPFRLAGLWAPAPPGFGRDEHYMGLAARQFVETVLSSAPAKVAVLPASGDGERRVRVSLGPDDSDLAVKLARLGLAMCDRPSAANSRHADEICAAERLARRDRVGMHDGGFQVFARTNGTVVDLGTALWWESLGRGTNRSSSKPSSRPMASGGKYHHTEWDTPAPMRSAITAIRDYGASMGLPRDASSLGR
jgi:endonuclease YncB( thermonuclease family)